MSIESEHHPWCASLTRMLTCMPPKPAPCDCKTQCVEHGECFGGKCIYPQLNRDVTTPREWVGLTEQEQGAIMEDLNAHGTNLYHFAKAIEAKLKEKNT